MGENFKVSVFPSAGQELKGEKSMSLRFRTPAKQMFFASALQKSLGPGHPQCCMVVVVPVTKTAEQFESDLEGA